jgi:hypothetical protein
VQTSLFDRFNVEAFTMPKYVDIVVDALISKDKLFSLIYFLYLMVHTYLGLWMEFFMHVAYPMFMALLMGPVFRFPKSW